jgi:hypothetical protein
MGLPCLSKVVSRQRATNLTSNIAQQQRNQGVDFVLDLLLRPQSTIMQVLYIILFIIIIMIIIIGIIITCIKSTIKT